MTASYSFASRAIDRHLDRAVDNYASWKKVQVSDSASSMEVLRSQVAENITAQEARLKSTAEQVGGEADRASEIGVTTGRVDSAETKPSPLD